MHIELYNEKWFDKTLQISIPLYIYQYGALKLPNETIPPFPSVAELHDKTNTYSPQHLIDRVNDNISELLYSCALYKSFAMTDCLFFIQYIPEDTIKLRCFLVQLKYIDKEILNIGDYHITSLSRHPVDKHIYDITARWWPE